MFYDFYYIWAVKGQFTWHLICLKVSVYLRKFYYGKLNLSVNNTGTFCYLQNMNDLFLLWVSN